MRFELIDLAKKTCYDDVLLENELAICAQERAKANGNNGHIPVVRYCECRELVIDGERQPCPPFHDCAYTKARTALVERACEIANEKAGEYAAYNKRSYKWTEFFKKAMDELAAPLLQQSENGQRVSGRPSKTAN